MRNQMYGFVKSRKPIKLPKLAQFLCGLWDKNISLRLLRKWKICADGIQSEKMRCLKTSYDLAPIHHTLQESN